MALRLPSTWRRREPPKYKIAGELFTAEQLGFQPLDLPGAYYSVEGELKTRLEYMPRMEDSVNYLLGLGLPETLEDHTRRLRTAWNFHDRIYEGPVGEYAFGCGSMRKTVDRLPRNMEE